VSAGTRDTLNKGLLNFPLSFEANAGTGTVPQTWSWPVPFKRLFTSHLIISCHAGLTPEGVHIPHKWHSESRYNNKNIDKWEYPFIKAVTYSTKPRSSGEWSINYLPLYWHIGQSTNMFTGAGNRIILWADKSSSHPHTRSFRKQFRFIKPFEINFCWSGY
jgi:hypothetical protein